MNTFADTLWNEFAVETDEHLALLRAAGCDQVQGYLFSRPRPLSELDFDLVAPTKRHEVA